MTPSEPQSTDQGGTGVVESREPQEKSVQQYSPVLRDGAVHMDYDMREGEWCRISDHYKAVRLERFLADERVAAAERKAGEKAKAIAPTPALNPTIRQLRDAVRFLRDEWGWSDGDIVFAAELDTSEWRTDATKPVVDAAEQEATR